MASDTRHGQERLRNDAGIPSKFLQDLQELYGRKVQEGNNSSIHRPRMVHLNFSHRHLGQELDAARHKAEQWP